MNGASGRALVVHGDNLGALRAAGRCAALRGAFRLAYCDPPYNTGRSLAFYDDARDKEEWRAELHERLDAVRALLAPDGVVALQIAGASLGPAQQVLDTVFGPRASLGLAVVKMSELSGVKMTHADRRLPRTVEFIFLYGAGNDARLRMLKRPKADAALERYLRYYTRIIDNPDDAVEAWRVLPLRDAARAHGVDPSDREALRAFQIQEAARVVYRTNCRALAGLQFPTETAQVVFPDGSVKVWWQGRQMLFLADHLDEHLSDLWTDISTINLHREGGVPFPNGKKPEALVRRLIELTTEPGDLVLDPWAGSGTVPAVCLKMGRRCLALEAGPQAHTHIAPRLQRVVDGDDAGGVTRDLGWRGGGAFRGVEEPCLEAQHAFLVSEHCAGRVDGYPPAEP